MKINNLAFFLLLSIILSGLMIAGYIFVHDKAETSNSVGQILAPAAKSYSTTAIPTGTLLALLVVGVIGVLGVSRKKEDAFSSIHKNATNSAAELHATKTGAQEPIVKKS
jgi:hypothetical protein